MPWHLCYDRLIHWAGLGHPGTFMMWDLELKFICWSFMAARRENRATTMAFGQGVVVMGG